MIEGGDAAAKSFRLKKILLLIMPLDFGLSEEQLLDFCGRSELKSELFPELSI